MGEDGAQEVFMISEEYFTVFHDYITCTTFVYIHKHPLLR